MISKELLLFQQHVRSLSQEFVEAQGGISAEFSTDSADLLFKIKTLHQNAVNSGGIVADWVIYPCAICKSHDKNRPLHVELLQGHPKSLYL